MAVSLYSDKITVLNDYNIYVYIMVLTDYHIHVPSNLHQITVVL